MLIDDVRARLRERLLFLGQGTKSNFIKGRLASVGLSETYLDQVLNSRRTDTGPLDPTLTKIEALAQALDASLPWLICGIGRPEAVFATKPAPRDDVVVGGLQARVNQRDAQKVSTSQAQSPRHKK